MEADETQVTLAFRPRPGLRGEWTVLEEPWSGEEGRPSTGWGKQTGARLFSAVGARRSKLGTRQQIADALAEYERILLTRARRTEQQAAAEQAQRERERYRAGQEASRAARLPLLRTAGRDMIRRGTGLRKTAALARLRAGLGDDALLPEPDGLYGRAAVYAVESLDASIARERDAREAVARAIEREEAEIVALWSAGKRAEVLARIKHWRTVAPWFVPTTEVDSDTAAVRRAAKRLGIKPLDKIAYTYGYASSRKDIEEYRWFRLQVPELRSELHRARNARRARIARGGCSATCGPPVPSDGGQT